MMAWMRRLLLLAPFAPAPAFPVGARGLGEGAPSLRDLAQARLQAHGLQVADALSLAQATRAAAASLGWSDPEGQSRQAARPLAELMRSGQKLEPWAAEGASSPRLRRLAQLALALRAQLKAAQRVSPAEACWLAASLPGPQEALGLRGPTHLSADELAWWEAVAGPGSELQLRVGEAQAYALPRQNAEALAASGWQVEGPEGAGSLQAWREAGRHWAAHVVPGDEEAEALAALGLARRALAEGLAPQDIALVVRDEVADAPRIAAAAATMGVAVALPAKQGLGQSRVGAYLALAMAAIAQDGAFEPALLALSHPMGPGLAPLSPAGVRARRPESWADWAQLGISVAQLAWPEGPRPQGEWVALLQALLEALPAPPAEAPPQAHQAHQLALSLPQRLALGAASASLSRQAFLAEWAEALAHLEVPPTNPTEGAIPLLGRKALGARPFQLLVVLGAHEGAFPAPLHDPAALPFAERKALASQGLVLDGPWALAQAEALQAFRLLGLAGRLTLLRPALLGKEASSPSPFLPAWGLAESPLPQVVDPAWRLAQSLSEWAEAEEQGPSATPAIPEAGPSEAADPKAAWEATALAAAQHGHKVEARREAVMPPDAHDGLLGQSVPTETRSFSATQLLALGQCPFRWFMGFGLGLRAPEEPGGALDPTLRGNLYHKALERAVEQVMLEGPMDAQAFRQAVVAALPAAFTVAEAEEGVPAWPGWEALRAGHLRALVRAVEAPDFLDPEAKPLGVELPFEGRWRGLKVKGKLDRADDGPDGLVLIDYKTRATLPTGAQDAEGKATLDLQLPIYAEAAASSVGPGRPVADVRYLSLTKGKRLNPPGASIDEGALAAFAARVHARFAVGAFPPAPDVQGKACGYCDHALACRKGPRLERRRAAGFLDPVAPMLPPSPKPGERRGAPALAPPGPEAT